MEKIFPRTYAFLDMSELPSKTHSPIVRSPGLLKNLNGKSKRDQLSEQFLIEDVENDIYLLFCYSPRLLERIIAIKSKVFIRNIQIDLIWRGILSF